MYIPSDMGVFANDGVDICAHGYVSDYYRLQENMKVSSLLAWCCTKQQCARRYPREVRQKQTN